MNKFMTSASSLNNVLLSTDEEEYDKLATEVEKQFSKATDLANSSLDNIDPSHQTIPYLYVINAHVDASLNSGKAAVRQLPVTLLPEGRLWPYISKFFLTFDAIQVRYVGQLFTRLVDVVARGAEQARDHVPAIQLLQHAIFRLDHTSSTLTSTHYQYIRLCLLARAYSDATTILDRPIYAIPSSDITKQVGSRAYKYLCSVHDSSSTYLTPTTGLTQRLTSRVYLEYFLMGAMCYMGVGDYPKALSFLEIVLLAPTVQSVTSVVQLDAYKKWALVNLIVKGKPVTLPGSISSSVARNIRTIAKPYDCIAEAFKTGSVERLQAEIQEGQDIWDSDGNYGLIHEVFAAFKKFAVLRLEKTYAALPIEDVARLISPDPTDVESTLELVNILIESGDIQAQLTPSSSGGAGILRFLPEQSLPEEEVEQQLALRTHELQQLLKQISEFDYQMEISKDYIEWLQKLKAARDREKKGTVTANRSIVHDVPDEDMMDDM